MFRVLIKRILTQNNSLKSFYNIRRRTDAVLVLGQADFTHNLGNRGGVVAANTLCEPCSVSVNTFGNVWIADANNHRVLKYNTPVTTGMDANLVLGQADFTHSSSNRGGSVAANTLRWPSDVSVDSSGNVWIADSDNERVLKYNAPSANGVDANLVLGQADFTHNSENRGGAVAANTLFSPNGVSVDNFGNVWVADSGNARVSKYDVPFVDGADASLVLGQNDFTHNGQNITDGKGLNEVENFVIDATTGRIYVADNKNHRVLWWNDFSSLTSGKQADGVLGQADLYSSQENRGGAVATNTLSWPSGVSVDNSGNIWVADSGNERVLKYNSPVTTGMDANLVLGQADFTHNSGNRGGVVAANTLYYPCCVSVDVSGSIWVIDGDNNRVLKYNVPSANGVDANLVLGQADFTSRLSNRGGAVAANTLSWPSGVSVDNSGNVLVADSDNSRVLKYNVPSANGVDANLVLGQADFTSRLSNRGGPVAANTLCYPSCASVDNSGNVWVADSGNEHVLKYNTPVIDGVDAVLVLGQADFVSDQANRGGPVAANTFDWPSWVSVDSSGNVWVADNENNRVLKYNTLAATSITPASGVNAGSVDITNLSGQGFATGSTVKLTKAGQTDITATNVSVVSASKITCTFDLTGKTTGYWNVVVTSGSYISTLSNGFAVLIAADNLQSINIFPNPYNPKVCAQGLTFDGLTAQATIKIYTIAGELVKEITETDGDGKAYWYGKNDADNEVARGIYIAFIKSDSDTKKLKIAVEK